MSGLTTELSLLSNIFNNFNNNLKEKCLILIDGMVKQSSFLENTALSISLVEQILNIKNSFSIVASNNYDMISNLFKIIFKFYCSKTIFLDLKTLYSNIEFKSTNESF
jgi:hypothetical protein